MTMQKEQNTNASRSKGMYYALVTVVSIALVIQLLIKYLQHN